MSAWVSPVCGLAFTMLSIFTASTRFSECTGSPVNGDRSWRAGDGDGACPQAARSTVTTPASTAAATVTALCLIHLIASSRAAHLTRMHHHTSRYHNGLPGGSLTPRATQQARPYSTATAVAP